MLSPACGTIHDLVNLLRPRPSPYAMPVMKPPLARRSACNIPYYQMQRKFRGWAGSDLIQCSRASNSHILLDCILQCCAPHTNQTSVIDSTYTKRRCETSPRSVRSFLVLPLCCSVS
ncbi:uncharacterized protein HMPREF1120_05203 [Exophiala dermatitidis NIH/UT8656]|uniref:Uncharacterized protein n=1 Tax=Exophiala dermatitidis (strain ATCC 34100 / CBS 525.76 / NIH/UT8656) TaxID=858893 RepID=H6C006_EXODN|nr:uncharacterized protein HMPREF1120_05203 [Exophiala dermatitidis NIH/UT8656]EHY57155.1 hypothetical protein HMPREF1120_05203 [Exophiala dermatitidis NIH/UT8656]